MLFILVPVFGRLNDTHRFLECCAKQSYSHFRLVIIDHGPGHRNANAFNGVYECVHFLKGEHSLWWTGAINLGLDYVLSIASENDYVMTINSDVTFDELYFEKMIRIASKNKDSVFNPIALNSDQNSKIFTTGTKVLYWPLALNKKPFIGKKLTDIENVGNIEVDYLGGRGTTIPVHIFRKIGRYDQDNFPHYGADDEFTLRAKRGGYKVFITPHVSVSVSSKSTGLNPFSRKLRIREVFASFFSIKSTNNLQIIYRFTKRCVPIYARPSYFFSTCFKKIILIFLSYLKN